MIILGGRSFENVPSFMEDLPAVRRGEVLKRLEQVFSMAYADPDIPRWIVNNISSLPTTDTFRLIQHLKKDLLEFSYQTLDVHSIKTPKPQG